MRPLRLRVERASAVDSQLSLASRSLNLALMVRKGVRSRASDTEVTEIGRLELLLAEDVEIDSSRGANFE